MKFNPTRRRFLGGALALSASAAIPNGVLAADIPTLWGDQIHDDAPAITAMMSGKPFKTADGFAGIAKAGKLTGSRHLLRSAVTIERDGVVIDGCYLALYGPDAKIVCEADTNTTITGCIFNSVDGRQDAAIVEINGRNFPERWA